MLHLAARIGEAQIDELDVLILDLLDTSSRLTFYSLVSVWVDVLEVGRFGADDRQLECVAAGSAE